MFTAIAGLAKKTMLKTLKANLPTHSFWLTFSMEELRKLTQIATPLIMVSLVTMSISITDVIMIGRLGTLQLAAGAAASDFYSIFFYLAAGVIAAISSLIAEARGRRQFRAIKSIAVSGMIAGFLAGIPAAIPIYHGAYFLHLIGVQPEIAAAAAPYSRTMAIAIFPMLAMMTMHYFLSAHGKTQIILIVTALALPINIFGNYLLLYGNLGFPNLGLAGAGIATAVTGTFMFLSMVCYVLVHPRLRRYLYFPSNIFNHFAHVREIVKIGLPIGICHVGEMGVFLFSTVTMGVFGAEVLAAHTIALRAAGVFYALPLGYAQAATVRIGYLSGQGDTRAIRSTLQTIINLALVSGVAIFIVIIAVKNSLPELVLDPQQITGVVAAEASMFLTLLAFMQPSVSLGTITAGALRGFKDTQMPMVFSLTSYWGLGFMGALVLAFQLGLDGAGIWLGLLLATIVFAAAVLVRIRNRFW
ncbi:MAG: MATE family efflux transporter [Gammaproteobacteria bacterium]|nr:MATE family efflux transporter [Gammaproteobacteria bacterium]